MAADGKYVRALRIKAGNKSVELVNRGDRLLIDFLNHVTALEFRHISSINHNSADAGGQIQLSCELGRQVVCPNRAKRVRVPVLLVWRRIRCIWLRWQRIAWI